MSETIAIHRAPCQSCPYRRDVPSGIWAPEEYDKILAYDEETWNQPPAVFMCHQADGALCRGWLDCHGSELLSVRIYAGRSLDAEQVAQALSEGPAVPVFATAAEAAGHGRRSIKRPGSKARKLMQKLERKQRIKKTCCEETN